MSSSSSRPLLTDSPWFWLLLFAGMALAALLVVSPKYARRQEGVERKFHAREELARRRATGSTGLPDQPDQEPPEQPNLIVPLWTLASGLAAIMLFALWQLYRSRRSASINSG